MMIRVGSSVAIGVSKRSFLYCLVTGLLIATAAVATLSLGRLGIALNELPSALLGGADGKTAFVLERLRGPRLATAIAVGALFGVSGALFQTVTRNPVGSPDVIGIGAGAGAGVALTATIGFVPLPVGAVLGAAAAAAVVFVSTGVGFRSPARTIIAGIAVAAVAYAIIQYVVSVELRDAATQLATYVVGSLNAANLTDVLVASVAMAILIPAAMSLSPKMRLLEMGDDTAASLGTDPDRIRTIAVVLSILASGAAVAAAGPISFVALTAPQIARRVIRSAEIGIVPAAVTGSLLMVLADLAAQQLSLVDGVPVGVLTLAVGGIYLGYLLTRERARGRL